ncbi:sigma-70 family RNA polymerase sigma factor [Paenibacillus allorhizosphaerae]|uniref:Sigma-70 family RNA polymerase sigma factor n=1 Tax=Paenibacillus allorhizosphaerae TaxID=2849866 RepID=A0ABM8VMU4_9BACL|nr:sigma-70 family RNA polymerase sigma factor [Paenibacillus allorhizosphaerae]CAG7650564.1 hypothetical protein PAECIP111802_04752 [Paenibacillus allorhizosphaerae]
MLQWIEEARKGDREAFEHLVRQFSAMAYAVAYDKLRDAHLAEDAVQEAFAEAFVHLRKLREPEAFPGWFKAIVIRQCNRLIRKKRYLTAPLYEMDNNAGSQPSVSDIAERKEMQSLLHDSIAHLSSNLRIAVQLFYFHGYSLREISDYVGTSVPVLKKRLHDARKKLKGMLPVADVVSVFHDLYEGGEHAMLHIVNGDSVAEKLRQGVVQGDILVWREIYPEGPVTAGPVRPAERQARASYLEKAMGIPTTEYIRLSEAQEKELNEFGKYKEVVLWFEHDLFDQTMLCYLLHWFARQTLGKTTLSLLSIGTFPGIELFRGLGQLSVSQLKTLSGTWQTIGQSELALGSTVWEAYCSPDPGELAQLINEENTTALPFVHDAFQLHLSRFPSTFNGLGVVEQTTLELVQCGLDRPTDLFEQAGNKLHWLGMGDLQYWRSLANMSQGASPLLKLEGQEMFPSYSTPSPSFRQCKVAMTELGKRVMEGKEDWVAVNGIDEWYGGVHLQGRSAAWRWDRTRNTVVKKQQ